MSELVALSNPECLRLLYTYSGCLQLKFPLELMTCYMRSIVKTYDCGEM